MVSQAIGLVVITAMISLVVAMVRKLNAETSVSEAQVRLRQASHMMLRDTQGISGENSSLGDLVTVTDGGATAADKLSLFKRDESVCGGGMKLNFAGATATQIPIENVDTDLTSGTNMVCPLTLAVCPGSEVTARTALLVGASRAVELTGHGVTGCNFVYPTGAGATKAVNAYNARYGTSHATLSAVIAQVQPTNVVIGTGFRYDVSGTSLRRSTDGGTTFETVLEGVQDFQLERVYFDDDTTNNGTVNFTGSTGAALPSGFEEEEFLGLRIGLITFSNSKNDLEVRIPATFSNRNHASAPTSRRYRASFIFAASRNRTGA